MKKKTQAEIDDEELVRMLLVPFLIRFPGGRIIPTKHDQERILRDSVKAIEIRWDFE